MVISSCPIVVGNQPKAEAEFMRFEKVAFVGQVPVNVRGRVEPGDFIVPSGHNDGVGVAVPPSKLTAELAVQIVGRAWDKNEGPHTAKVTVLVGPSSAQAMAQAVAGKSAVQEERIRALEAELAKLRETVKVLSHHFDQGGRHSDLAVERHDRTQQVARDGRGI
jgi:hypothetical protein